MESKVTPKPKIEENIAIGQTNKPPAFSLFPSAAAESTKKEEQKHPNPPVNNPKGTK